MTGKLDVREAATRLPVESEHSERVEEDVVEINAEQEETDGEPKEIEE